MKITCLKNGPYLVNLEIVKITDEPDNIQKLFKASPIALCRCGMSAIKSFCDDQHKHVGFEAEYTELDERSEL